MFGDAGTGKTLDMVVWLCELCNAFTLPITELNKYASKGASILDTISSADAVLGFECGGWGSKRAKYMNLSYLHGQPFAMYSEWFVIDRPSLKLQFSAYGILRITGR